MKPEIKSLLEAALKLSPEARADLAGCLIDSLDEEVEDGAESAWAEEIARRLDDMESGRVKPVPWSEARRRIMHDGTPSGGA